jgi:hypothetical protein
LMLGYNPEEFSDVRSNAESEDDEASTGITSRLGLFGPAPEQGARADRRRKRQVVIDEDSRRKAEEAEAKRAARAADTTGDGNQGPSPSNRAADSTGEGNQGPSPREPEGTTPVPTPRRPESDDNDSSADQVNESGGVDESSLEPRSDNDGTQDSDSTWKPDIEPSDSDPDDSSYSSDSSSDSDSDSDFSDGSEWSSDDESMSDEPKRRRLYWDGNRTGFEAFFEDFEIRAVKKGFEGHISETMNPDLPANGEIADMTLLPRDEEKKAKKALKRHRIAVCELRLAVKKETISPIVSQTIEADTWPYGRMWLIVKELFRKYRGDSVLDILQLTLDIPLIRMTESI